VERKRLEAREATLLGAHKASWTDALCRALEGKDPFFWAPEWRKRIDFERGFIRSLILGFDSALQLIESGLEPEPIRALEIFGHTRNHPHSAVIAIGSWKAGNCVRAFGLAGATDGAVHAFLNGGRLTRLFRLDFWQGSVTNAAVVALARSPLVASVTSLSLSTNQIGDEGALALVTSPHLPEVRWLNLSGNQIGKAARDRLRERFGNALQIESEP
jgi:hypothetical protein